MRWEINFIVTYEVEASSKWEAIEKAQAILNSERAGDIDYDIDVEILHYEEE